MIKLLVGLGNPGPEYEATRHNAGFWWIDAVARQLKATLQAERSYFGLVGRVNLPQGPLWLLEPQTYMNLSGKSVSALARFFKIAPEEILVAHDELDLPPGQLKLKQGGGHAGHNGLRDIHAQLGSPNYWRLRLGIGHPGVKADVAGYVLRRPPSDEVRLLEGTIIDSLGALDLILAGDMTRAMARLHGKANIEKKPTTKVAAPAAPADATSPAPPASKMAPQPPSDDDRS